MAPACLQLTTLCLDSPRQPIFIGYLLSGCVAATPSTCMCRPLTLLHASNVPTAYATQVRVLVSQIAALECQLLQMSPEPAAWWPC